MIAIKGDPTAIMRATSQTLRRMQQLTGFNQRTVLIGFAGVVLKTWAGRTKVATQAQIDRRARLRAIKKLGFTQAPNRGSVTVNTGFRAGAPFGRVWLKVRNGAGRRNFLLAKGADFTAPTGTGIFTAFGRQIRGTSGRWLSSIDTAETAVAAAVPRAIAAGRKSTALSRQSVVQIADALGIDLLRVEGGGSLSAAGIAKARAALASTGRSHRNGVGLQGGDGIHDYVDLINKLPYGRRIGMDRTLLGVLAGQNKYFETSYAKGAFESQHKAAAAFPNLFKVATAA